MIKRLQQLTVKFHHELYTVSKSTLRAADRNRRCWICGGKFRIGDGMTVVGSDEGNKLMHIKCFKAQQ